MKILDFFEQNYFKFGISYLLFFTLYMMTSIIVPLNFFNANSYVTILLSGLGALFGLYNIVVKKALTKTRGIRPLIVLFVVIIISLVVNMKYGYIDNVKDLIVFFVYFFSIYPFISFITKEQANQTLLSVGGVLAVLSTGAVIASLFQFVTFDGYIIESYKGNVFRQGFIDSRLFGVFTDPNIQSVVSLLTITYLGYLQNKVSRPLKVLLYLAIFCNFTYIVLSGSRTALIIISAVFVYIFIVAICKKDRKKQVLNVIMLGLITFGSYHLVYQGSQVILKANTQVIAKINQEHKNTGNYKVLATLQRNDTDAKNISNNRFSIWQDAIKFSVKRPIFGYTSGNWEKIAKEIDPDSYIVKKSYRVHNGYLEILFYSGFIALLAFFWYVGKPIIKTVVNELKTNSQNLIIEFILIGLIILGVTNMFISATMYGFSIWGLVLHLSISYLNNGYLPQLETKDK